MNKIYHTQIDKKTTESTVNFISTAPSGEKIKNKGNISASSQAGGRGGGDSSLSPSPKREFYKIF